MNSTALTADQIALEAHIAADNAAYEAKCIGEGASFWCVSALTAADLAEYGVYNVVQYKLWQAEVDMAEAAKERRKNW